MRQGKQAYKPEHEEYRKFSCLASVKAQPMTGSRRWGGRGVEGWVLPWFQPFQDATGWLHLSSEGLHPLGQPLPSPGSGTHPIPWLFTPTNSSSLLLPLGSRTIAHLFPLNPSSFFLQTGFLHVPSIILSEWATFFLFGP